MVGHDVYIHQQLSHEIWFASEASKIDMTLQCFKEIKRHNSKRLSLGEGGIYDGRKLISSES